MNSEKLQYIIDCLPGEELLAQLAEEASELSHAALKLRRCLDGTNPSRVPKEDAWKQLFEEIADVWLSLKALGLDTDSMLERYRDIQAKKVYRWADSLEWGADV
jgi:NTP pyrophosphatase (non-canonical NTP hydrolase)